MIRLLHLALAFNLLVSTTGMAVFEHICQMRGMTVSLVSSTNTKSCCAQKKVAPKGHCVKPAVAHVQGTASGPMMTKTPCCQEHGSWIKADIDGTSAVAALSATPSVATAWLVLAKADLPQAPQTETLSLKVVQAMHYKPPSPTFDLRVRVQSFQI